MNAKVDSYISDAINSGTISGSDLAALAALYDSGGLSSIQNLDGLPSSVQTLIRDAFREAVRWSFISLIPWAGVATISSLFLSKIQDTDAIVAEGPRKETSDNIRLGDTSQHGEKQQGRDSGAHSQFGHAV